MTLKYRQFLPEEYGVRFQVELTELKNNGIDLGVTYLPSKTTVDRILEDALEKYRMEYATSKDLHYLNGDSPMFVQLGLLDVVKEHPYLEAQSFEKVLSVHIYFNPGNAALYNDIFNEVSTGLEIHDIDELLNGTFKKQSQLQHLMKPDLWDESSDGANNDFENVSNALSEDDMDLDTSFENPFEVVKKLESVFGVDRMRERNRNFHKHNDDKEETYSSFILEFTDIEDVISCAKAMIHSDTGLKTKQSLYFNDGNYYLDVLLPDYVAESSIKNYLSRLSEYGVYSEVTKEVIAEYYKNIIADEAFNCLSSSFS